MLLRSSCLAVIVLTGCQTNGGGGAGAHGATSSNAATSLSGNATTPATGAAPAATPTPPTQPPAAEGMLRLLSGAMLTMPASANATRMKNAAGRLPGVVREAHKYQLGDAKRLLLVNEMDREGLDCKGVLDRELERANKAKTDTDEKKQAVRQMKGITEISIGSHRALYAVSQNRPPTVGTPEADTSRPMLGVATLIMCRDKDYVVIMHAADQSAEPEDTKKILVDIAASYRPAG